MPVAFPKYIDTALLKNLTLFVYFREQLAASFGEILSIMQLPRNLSGGAMPVLTKNFTIPTQYSNNVA